ncbi:iron-sulfur cluster-binding protein [Myriangium duriaei CBS 260.36]|uniref:Choline monooxygenase, chloroplastic n=1 Tax=Myriangium duriaei CBS 260.36 TaxID=1168546 RepID=A0A9P4MBY4_9PEZI|nr:iron-sulfur cluster-binding protein [Myriangium duriaei CBS 260.36]
MFGIGKMVGGLFGQSTQEDPASLRDALPSSWYASEAMYELERRAIFSKKWVLVSHSARFQTPGQFLRTSMAGTDIFLVKTRAGAIQAFHNICRHRVHPILQSDSGAVNILSCKYHGWSYGLDGRLAKAPQFQDVTNFDPGRSALFPVHVHIDKLGFVWVNLDASEKPASWQDDFDGVDEQPRLKGFEWSSYQFDHQWEMLGDYNWKTLADNYNECYHCSTGHPGVSAVSDLSKYWVETKAGHIVHWNVDKADTTALGVFSTFYYPNTSMTISPHFMYIMRCIPISASQTKMEYEVYRHRKASDKDFTDISEFFKQVLREDKDLCNAAQKNLNAGIFTAGKLHPQREKGTLYFQKLTKEQVMEHRKLELLRNENIYPAMPLADLTTKQSEEIAFCKALDCEHADKTKPELVW